MIKKLNYFQDKEGEFLRLATRYADMYFDGHLTILKFTTHWKVVFGTPDFIYSGMDEKCEFYGGHKEIKDLIGYKSLGEALLNLLDTESNKSPRKYNDFLKVYRSKKPNKQRKILQDNSWSIE